MAERRIFYVTQQELVVYLRRRGRFEECARFHRDDGGLSEFSSYMKSASQQPSAMLVDVIEEELYADSIPRLGIRDRKALIERRLMRKFPRTSYRLGHYQVGKHRKKNTHEVMYSAVSNPELLDAWLQVLMTYKTPLSEIRSVPMLGAELFAKLFNPGHNALFMTLHQGNMLRQVFVRDGFAKSARLSKSPDIVDPAFGDFVFAEVSRSRRYLERSRLLSVYENIDVYLLADRETSDLVMAGDQGTMPIKIHFMDPVKAANAVGLNAGLESNHQEFLYLAMMSRSRKRSCYALRSESRYFRLQKLRHAMVGAALAASVGFCAAAGINVVDGLFLRSASAATDRQIQRIAETLQRENENFAPVRANSNEMKLAVDTGDYILHNRLPVAWVMGEIASVLGAFPQIRIEQLNWSTRPPDNGQSVPSRQRPGEQPLPVSISALTSISVELSAQITPFGGDMRVAFASINRFVAALQENTAFDQVTTTQYPLDASPQSSISGEVVRGGATRSAQFRLRLEWGTMTGESSGENG
ncbi:MAG: hypothetical protein GXP15_01090 [Gammaproteobacteria bacterium]|nr:hypothetical protein [Gammaproteobacteria bacterium]